MADGPGSENPFENLPMFGDLARALAGQGPLNWDAARQFAALAATGGAAEANIDPSVRIKLGELAQIAELHVRDLTGFDGPSPEVVPVTVRCLGAAHARGLPPAVHRVGHLARPAG